MSSDAAAKLVETTRAYYNSDDADTFYAIVWGGEDIHVGMYQSDGESIFDASRRTVEHLGDRLRRIDQQSRILDLGAGYGGAARWLAGEFGCHVTALNLSEVENERNRAMNRAQGLDERIAVVDGSFEDLAFDDASFDIIWSQDAILHSGRRADVLAEAHRVLKPGGQMVFTDPMQADDCPAGVLQPIYDRIHLASLGSPAFYQEAGRKMGFSRVAYEDHTAQLPRHYARVLAETRRRLPELKGKVSDDYLERMQRGLQHWVEGGQAGYLAWGVFDFTK